jgi:hypothetical protein
MANRILTETVDDLDGQSGAETVTFSIDGVFYDIDLAAANRERLRHALAPYVEAGRVNSDVRQYRKVPVTARKR